MGLVMGCSPSSLDMASQLSVTSFQDCSENKNPPIPLEFPASAEFKSAYFPRILDAPPQPGETLPIDNRPFLSLSFPQHQFESKGQSQQAEVKLFDSKGNTLPLEGRKLKFSSDYPDQFSVDEKGQVKALTENGESRIKVSAEDGSLVDAEAFVFIAQNRPNGISGQAWKIHSFSELSQRRPLVTSNGKDQFVIAWYRSNPLGHQKNDLIFAQRYSLSGNPLGKEIQVTPAYFGNSAMKAMENQYPNLLMSISSNEKGEFAVVWLHIGEKKKIFVQQYNSCGQALGSPLLLFTITEEALMDPIISYGLNREMAITWGVPKITAGDYSHPPERSEIWLQKFNTQGKPLHAAIQITANGSGIKGSQIAMDGQGNSVVVYQEGLQLYFQRFDHEMNRTHVAKAIDMSGGTPVADYKGFTQLEMNQKGDFIVSWSGAQPLIPNGLRSDLILQLCHFDSNGNLKKPCKTEHSYDDFFKETRAAINRQGESIVIWLDSSDSFFRQIWNPLGVSQLTTEQIEIPITLPNSLKTRLNDNFDVALFENGKFVIAWETFAENSFDTDIYAQIFSP